MSNYTRYSRGKIMNQSTSYRTSHRHVMSQTLARRSSEKCARKNQFDTRFSLSLMCNVQCES